MDMPLIQQKHNDDGSHILIFRDTENLSFFLERTKLSDEELTLINKYSVERRKKDLVITRYLIQQLIPKAQVAYHASGKPYLKNGEAEISITHSKDLVAVIIHKDKVVGIDIEYISPRVERIKQRFLSPKELLLANSTALLTLYWSAKETLFKLDKNQGLEFNTQLTLRPESKNTLKGNIRNGEDITVHYTKNEEWVMTYALL